MSPPAPARLGKYEIVQELGAGAMGVVYLGYDAAIDRKVAVKTIRKEGLDPETAATAGHSSPIAFASASCRGLRVRISRGRRPVWMNGKR